ncbi:hypothetical protein GGR52DRAFT_548274 [Hypoxylon sp. FL1284]|nr:hypothetical protein GGR52DRAFT_548274 [Hypoxylon sp. FL1284]
MSGIVDETSRKKQDVSSRSSRRKWIATRLPWRKMYFTDAAMIVVSAYWRVEHPTCLSSDAGSGLISLLSICSLESLDGGFDIVFVDMAFEAYQSTVEAILKRKLLARDGVILADNVFARGFAVDKANLVSIDLIITQLAHWEASGELMKQFNIAMKNDKRVDTLVLPMFDGISEIRWRTDAPLEGN